MKIFAFISLLLFSGRMLPVTAVNLFAINNFNSVSEINLSAAESLGKPNPVWFNFFKKQSNRKKTISTLLAFPIPGGLLGLHRIYLGTKPYVPLIYILTLGGGLFVLPMIDFFVLLSNKDISRFENHPGIFMWIDNPKKPAETKPESK